MTECTEKLVLINSEFPTGTACDFSHSYIDVAHPMPLLCARHAMMS